jgi:hypothetical protein
VLSASRIDGGKTPIPYLFSTEMAEAAEAAQYLIQISILDRLDLWGLPQWRADIASQVDELYERELK